MFKNRGVAGLIEQDVYKNVLQRAEWALPRPFLYTHEFKRKVIISESLVADIATYHFCDLQNKLINFIPANIWNVKVYNFISYPKMKMHDVDTFRSHGCVLLIIANLPSVHKGR
jgi:hypothetical protein